MYFFFDSISKTMHEPKNSSVLFCTLVIVLHNATLRYRTKLYHVEKNNDKKSYFHSEQLSHDYCHSLLMHYSRDISTGKTALMREFSIVV